MKKLVILILSLTFSLSLAACGELSEDIKYGRDKVMSGIDSGASKVESGINSAADDLKDGASSIIDDASELMDGSSNNSNGNSNLSDDAKITKDEAKKTAFGDAGVKESEVSALKVELDRDGNTLKYEVDFYHAGTEYEYDIDASTGKIISKDTDQN